MTKQCQNCGNVCADSASICLRCHCPFGRGGYDKRPELVGCGRCGGTETTPGRGYIEIRDVFGLVLRTEKCPNRCNGGWIRV